MLKSKPIKGKEKKLSNVDVQAISNIAKERNLLSFVCNNIDAYVWTVDKDFNFTFFNSSLATQLNLNFDSNYEHSFLACVSDNCRLRIIEKVQNAFDNRGADLFELEIDFYVEKVEIASVESRVFIQRDKVGLFDGLVFIANRVAEIEETLLSQKEREANLLAQIENTVDSIWSINSDFKIMSLNTNFKTYFEFAFGVSLEFGSRIIDYLPEPFNIEWKTRYEKALLGERYSITDHFTFENVPQYVEVTFHPIVVDDNVIGVSCFSRDVTAQKMSEIAIVESEKKYKALVANIPSVSYRCRVSDGWVLDFVSDEIERLSGYSSEEFMNNDIRAFSGIIHPDDRQIVEEFILSSLYKKDGYKLEYRIVHKNGSIKWVSERGRASLDENGKIEWLSGVISDITKRVYDRENLEKSEEKFRQIFEQSNSSISIQTKDKILMVNSAWEKITGYSFIESADLLPLDIVHPQVKEEMRIKINKAYDGEEFINSFVLHTLDKERNEKWVDVSISLIDYDNQKAILLIGTDITIRKKTEIEINKLSTGIMNSPSSIVITDIDGNIEYVNPFFCESTGYSVEEVMGQNPRILQSGGTPSDVFSEMWGTILKGEVWHGEFENVKKSGEKYWERARIAPIKDENNIIISFVAIKEDVTEQKRYQEMIEQSEKDLRDLNAKKDKFFSIIAHDLRSPFVGLVGLTDLLRTNFDELSDEKIQYYIKFANESAHNVFRLLETLLEWAKSQTGRMEFRLEAMELSELIQDAIGIAALSAKSKDVTLVNFVFKSRKIVADKNMIFTILRNLVSNAIKYTPRNGRVSIDVKDEENRVVVSVSDNGVGIPKEKQVKLFKMEENYSTIGTDKEKGSGLGLLLCKEFIEKHAGDIWCESEKDMGSTFYFSIPKRTLKVR